MNTNESNATTSNASTLQPAAHVAPQPGSGIDFTALGASVTAANAALGPNPASLTIAGRRRLTKMRPGGLAYVGTVLDAVERYGLVLPGVNRQAAERDLQLLNDLAPVSAGIDALNATIGDIRRSAESRVWKATVAAYSTLVRFVPEHPALQRELAPMASLLALKHKSAPTALRAQEQRSLAKGRATRKAKKAAADASAAKDAAPPQADPPPTLAGKGETGATAGEGQKGAAA